MDKLFTARIINCCICPNCIATEGNWGDNYFCKPLGEEKGFLIDSLRIPDFCPLSNFPIDKEAEKE